jgi:hypothetical protein
MLSPSQIQTIRGHRHSVRLNGCWGGCYEVSCFIEHEHGWRRRDGVYQLADGRPVFRHAWNEADDGTIIDGTADQFFHGADVVVLARGDDGYTRYRERYTIAHNPAITPWLATRPYVGIPDDEYWKQRYEAGKLGPGWWLADNAAYLEWLVAGAGDYWQFAAKLREYRESGFPV